MDIDSVSMTQMVYSMFIGGIPPPPPPPMIYGADGSVIPGSSEDLTSEVLDAWFSGEGSDEVLSNLLTEA